MMLFKNIISLLFCSILSFTMSHIIFNLLLRGDLIFKNIKLKFSKIFLMLLIISFIGALVMSFMNIERSMVRAFVGGISGFLVLLQKRNFPKTKGKS